MAEEEIGIVESFFAKPVVAAIKITGSLNVGDTIHIKGHTTDIVQTVDSMQIEHDQISTAKAGDEIGIKVTDRVRPHDHVYRVVEE